MGTTEVGRYGQLQLSDAEVREYREMALRAVYALRPGLRLRSCSMDLCAKTSDDWTQEAWMQAVRAAQAFHDKTQGIGSPDQRKVWVRTAIWNYVRSNRRKHMARWQNDELSTAKVLWIRQEWATPESLVSANEMAAQVLRRLQRLSPERAALLEAPTKELTRLQQHQKRQLTKKIRAQFPDLAR